MWKTFFDGYANYASYLWSQLSEQPIRSYFYWLVGVSLFFFILEWIRPWRANQPKFRKDFWLDCFYMFFNFFLFWLVIYAALSDVVVIWVNDFIFSTFGIDLQRSNPMQSWPYWAILLTGFLVRDFVQWNTHRLLHRVPRLWEFHKVHHSVQQMGFAAHLRYHWMETIVYRTIEYLPLAILGIGLYDFFVIYIFTLIVGHYNHSNITVPPKYISAILGAILGLLLSNHYFDIHIIEHPTLLKSLLAILLGAVSFAWLLGDKVRYIFNSPEMHIWHHAKAIPNGHKYGVNYGLTLSVWDYLFGTASIPYNGKDIVLGFKNVKDYPKDFWHQITSGFGFFGEKK